MKTSRLKYFCDETEFNVQCFSEEQFGIVVRCISFPFFLIHYEVLLPLPFMMNMLSHLHSSVAWNTKCELHHAAASRRRLFTFRQHLPVFGLVMLLFSSLFFALSSSWSSVGVRFLPLLPLLFLLFSFLSFSEQEVFRCGIYTDFDFLNQKPMCPRLGPSERIRHSCELWKKPWNSKLLFNENCVSWGE